MRLQAHAPYVREREQSVAVGTKLPLAISELGGNGRVCLVSPQNPSHISGARPHLLCLGAPPSPSPPATIHGEIRIATPSSLPPTACLKPSYLILAAKAAVHRCGRVDSP